MDKPFSNERRDLERDIMDLLHNAFRTMWVDETDDERLAKLRDVKRTLQELAEMG